MRTHLTTLAATLALFAFAAASAASIAVAGTAGSAGGGGAASGAGGGSGGGFGGGGSGHGGGAGGAHGGGGRSGGGGLRGGSFGGGVGYAGQGSFTGYAVHGAHGGYSVVGSESAGLAAPHGEPGSRDTLTLGPNVGSAATATRVADRAAPRPGRPPKTHPVVNLSQCLGGGGNACMYALGPSYAFPTPYCFPSIEQNRSSWPLGCNGAVRLALPAKAQAR
jgi:hypothetical protein